MRAARALAVAAPLALALCLWAPRAEAQNNNLNLEMLGVLLAPPAVAALICDFVTIGTLTTGHAYRGSTITGTIMGGVTTLFSFLAMAIALTSPNLFPVWIPASSVGLALGLGSVLVNIYGIAHPPPPEPEPARRLDLPSGGYRGRDPRSGAGRERVRFYPSVWVDRGGAGALGTIAVAL